MGEKAAVRTDDGEVLCTVQKETVKLSLYQNAVQIHPSPTINITGKVPIDSNIPSCYFNLRKLNSWCANQGGDEGDHDEKDKFFISMDS